MEYFTTPAEHPGQKIFTHMDGPWMRLRDASIFLQRSGNESKIIGRKTNLETKICSNFEI